MSGSAPVDFDIARIVPSTRDLFGALATRRKGLALLPLIEGDPAGQTQLEVARLDEMDVRAFAHSAVGESLQQAATSSSSTPSLCFAVAPDADGCQRARFFGADGVCIPSASWADLSKTAQSMRMMAIGHAVDAEGAVAAQQVGARAIVIEAALEVVLAASKRLPSPTILIARLADADPETIRALSGHVDAAIVPADVHRSDAFEALLEALDS
jgi:hypothetical protein